MTTRRYIRSAKVVGTLGLAGMMALPLALLMAAAGGHTSVVGPAAPGA